MDRDYQLFRAVMFLLSLGASLAVMLAAVVLMTPKPPSAASGIPEWQAATKRAQLLGASLAAVACAFIAWSFFCFDGAFSVTFKSSDGQQTHEK